MNEFRMNNRSGNGTGGFKVKIRVNTAKFSNMIIARFRESRYLIRESKVFIKGLVRVAFQTTAGQVP